MGMPTISVTFRELASTATARAARGRLAILIKDATEDVAWTHKTYTRLSEVDEDEFSAANYAAVARAFRADPYRVLVARVGSTGTLAEAAALLEGQTYHWICTPESGWQSSLAAYVKTLDTDSRSHHVMAVVCGVTGADHEDVANVGNTSVTESGESSTTAMAAYLPRLGATLAACPLDGSVTYAALDDLDDVAAVADPGAAIDAGSLVLVKEDDTVYIARGVNTLQTLGSGKTAAMKKIAVMEALNLIREDIILNFKRNYLGKVRNSPDNQALFISDVLEYFKLLEAEQLLNPEEENSAWIDTEAMRQAWEADGVDVSGLTDEEIRQKPYGSSLFVAARIRVLDAMEDMIMVIGLQ